MKKVSEILTHLLESPNFEKLRKKREAINFTQMLPLSLKSGIAFSYTKDSILFFVFKHPCFKQEFYHKIPLIKQLLKEYQQKKCGLLEIQDIRCFVQHNIYQKEVESLQASAIPLTYGELSKGEFKNLATGKRMHTLFEDIRKIILNNQK